MRTKPTCRACPDWSHSRHPFSPPQTRHAMSLMMLRRNNFEIWQELTSTKAMRQRRRKTEQTKTPPFLGSGCRSGGEERAQGKDANTVRGERGEAGCGARSGIPRQRIRTRFADARRGSGRGLPRRDAMSRSADTPGPKRAMRGEFRGRSGTHAFQTRRFAQDSHPKAYLCTTSGARTRKSPALKAEYRCPETRRTLTRQCI